MRCRRRVVGRAQSSSGMTLGGMFTEMVRFRTVDLTSTPRSAVTMTINQLKVVSGGLKEWPTFSSSRHARSLEVVSLEARSLGVSLDSISDLIWKSGAFGSRAMYLLLTGEPFEAGDRLAAALAARAEPLTGHRLANAISTGCEIVQGRPSSAAQGVHWGVSTLEEPGDFAAGLSLGRGHRSLVIGTSRTDVDSWCRVAVQLAMREGFKRDSLFVGGVESLRPGDLLVRSWDLFGDPPSVDIVGDKGALSGLDALRKTSKPTAWIVDNCSDGED